MSSPWCRRWSSGYRRPGFSRRRLSWSRPLPHPLADDQLLGLGGGGQGVADGGNHPDQAAEEQEAGEGHGDPEDEAGHGFVLWRNTASTHRRSIQSPRTRWTAAWAWSNRAWVRYPRSPKIRTRLLDTWSMNQSGMS